ncbi:type I-E CRISPR-associated protein Cse1/CasA [Cronobacter sakazakii]|nr:type I-E CRISPR-associated protein Cse1/CasA [Cronobacter sakazakii]EJC1182382.1 type I-E CRISPR-associated protein Cse1/CasA [Cronobacter sakazakii]EJC1242756.1 type I-E CRISPR-associated protein Cse1/CasA [Cronobacter sakazakii]EJC2073146.1 type I-E CRISPR-associated protein Cse1/CasA [Cronobacter sakazakii]EKK7728955.1 type I-E CRISPR-associated protein Cse1/CasA [Cronobacter sakazakii]
MHFNLITTKWLPVIYRDGTRGKIAPLDLADENILDLILPRPDFQGAAWQFLLGLLQTALAPKDAESWEDIWEDGLTADTIRNALTPLEKLFEFGPDTPSFMQDFEPLDGESVALALLLPEAPGAQTLKLNKDHFIKRGTTEKFCPHCAALALFSLQLNAPSGGKGYRTGLRGGGPMTTLLELHRYQSERPALWRRLWLNVLPQREGRLPRPASYDARVFPWLAPTRTSEKASDIITPEQADALQAYWGMPRRIRVDFSTTLPGTCDLCGEPGEALLTSMTVKNYGVNYVGWMHPLTPHRIPKKEGGEMFSVKGQPGGLLWRDWLGLMMESESDNNREQPARIVKIRQQKPLPGAETGLWCFGYDFDNMKARCWYEHHLPFLQLPESQQPFIRQTLSDAARVATLMLSKLRSALKEAWFGEGATVRGDFSFIDTDFWQQTQPRFLELVEAVKADTSGDNRALLSAWNSDIWRYTRRYFDDHALTNPQERTEFADIMKARKKFFTQAKAKPAAKGARAKKPQEAN